MGALMSECAYRLCGVIYTEADMGGEEAWRAGVPPLVLKKKGPADIAYDWRGISGSTSTLALAVTKSSF